MSEAFLQPGDVEFILAGLLLAAALAWQFGGQISEALGADCFSDQHRSAVGYSIIIGAVLVVGFAVHSWAGWVYEQAVLWGLE